MDRIRRPFFRIVGLLLVAASFAPQALAFSSELSVMGSLSSDKTKREPGSWINAYVVSDYLFLLGRFGIGPEVVYTRNLSTAKSDYTVNAWSFGLGPVAKYYFADPGKDFISPFITGSLRLERASDSFGSDVETSTGQNIAAGAGVAIFLTKAAALSVVAAYANTFTKEERDLDSIGTGEDRIRTKREMSSGVNFWLTVYL